MIRTVCDCETSVAGIAGRVGGSWPDEHAGAGDAYPRSGERVSVYSCALSIGGAPRLRDFIHASLSAIRSARSVKSGSSSIAKVRSSSITAARTSNIIALTAPNMQAVKSSAGAASNQLVGKCYLRASTDEQDASRVREQVEAFATERGLAIGTYVENESGAKLARPTPPRGSRP